MIFHEEHMRAEMAPPPRALGKGGSAVIPLAAGRWFITNKDYPGNGTFCPFGSLSSRGEPSSEKLGAH